MKNVVGIVDGVVSVKTCWPGWLLDQYNLTATGTQDTYRFKDLERRLEDQMQLYCTVFKGQLLETSCNKDVVKDPSPWPVPMYLDARWIYRHFSVAPGNLCSIFRISCKLANREVWEKTQERYTRRYLDRFCVQWTTIKMKQLVPQKSRTNEMPWFRALPIPQRQTASILDLVVMDPNEKTKIPVLAIQKRKEGQGAHAQYFLVFGIRSYSCLL